MRYLSQAPEQGLASNGLCCPRIEDSVAGGHRCWVLLRHSASGTVAEEGPAPQRAIQRACETSDLSGHATSHSDHDDQSLSLVTKTEAY